MTIAAKTRAGSTIRSAHLLAGAAAAAAAISAAVVLGTGLSSVLLFAVLPDLAFIAAIGQPHQPGQLPPRAVPLYNLLHRRLLPALLLSAAALDLLGTYWLVAGLSWAAHIEFDRAFGYGLRTAGGWQRQ